MRQDTILFVVAIALIVFVLVTVAGCQSARTWSSTMPNAGCSRQRRVNTALLCKRPSESSDRCSSGSGSDKRTEQPRRGQ